MELFKFDKNKVILSPGGTRIKEFKVLWDRDETKEKETATNELAYVYFVADYKTIYLSTPPDEREEVIIQDVFGEKSKWKPDKLVLQAVKKYEDLQYSPALRFLQSQRHALEQLMVYYKSVKGANIIDPKKLSASMSDSAKVLEALDKIEERVRKELSAVGKVRGQGELGEYEDPEE